MVPDKNQALTVEFKYRECPILWIQHNEDSEFIYADLFYEVLHLIIFKDIDLSLSAFCNYHKVAVLIVRDLYNVSTNLRD